jgi:hypothetical protein
VIEYRGALTEDDYVAFVRLSRRLLPGGSTPGDGRLVAAAICVLLAGWGYFGGSERNPESFWWLAVGAPFVFWWTATRHSPRRRWRTIPALRGEYQGCLTDDAYEGHHGTDARIPWPLFSGCARSSALVVLALGPRMVPLARGFFRSEGDWDAARGLVQRKVSSVASGQSSHLHKAILWLLVLLTIILLWHFATIRRVQRAAQHLDAPDETPSTEGFRRLSRGSTDS